MYSRSEGGVWCGVLEGNKEGMTFNEEQFRFLHGGWKKSEILEG